MRADNETNPLIIGGFRCPQTGYLHFAQLWWVDAPSLSPGGGVSLLSDLRMKGLVTVARKPRSNKPAEKAPSRGQQYHLPNEAPWGGFINIKIDDEQKAEFFAWVEANAAHYSALFDDMLGDGLKASFSFDAEHECYILSLQGALLGSDPTKRYVSTSRAGTLPEVIALTVWKHVELAKGDYGNFSPKDSSFMRWG